MAQTIGSKAEAEMAIERLLDKMEAWILQQPEVLLIWTQDRYTRKEAARAIADMMTTIPRREADTLNRAARKRLFKALDAADREWWRGIEI